MWLRLTFGLIFISEEKLTYEFVSDFKSTAVLKLKNIVGITIFEIQHRNTLFHGWGN
jgi:hypothetical protein